MPTKIIKSVVIKLKIPQIELIKNLKEEIT